MQESKNKNTIANKNKIKTLGVLLFDQFELLDVTGPVEMFSYLQDDLKIIFIAEKKGLIKSAQSLSVAVDFDFETAPKIDYLFIPGGLGTRTEVHNQKLITWINQQAKKSELIISVCTGAALLAKAGVLDNRKATSNKLAFDWVTEQGNKTQWIRHARWVDDGNIITSSGVAAGIDMSLYLIARLYGEDKRDYVSKKTEYVFDNNPDHDEFAE